MTVLKSARLPTPPVRKPRVFTSRYQWTLLLLVLVVLVLGGRALYLHLIYGEFLQSQGDVRLLRSVVIPAHRGMLLDRRGEPLAVSAPVDSVWVHPARFNTAKARWPALAADLEMTPAVIAKILRGRMQREFVYLQRHLPPARAARIRALDLPGLYLQREYRRYYPAAEITAHVVGLTDIDDHGLEGMELTFDRFLQGTPGSRRVIQDRQGRIIADVALLQAAKAGRDIRLSVDRRISYLAHRELTAAVARHHAKAGSLMVIDTRSGEVLAMVNQPDYNPNQRKTLDSAHYRNRAATDVFEPGSTLKPFTVAAALVSGQYTAASIVDTTPGVLEVGHYRIRDPRNYGKINVRTILVKSSNVGAGKLALSLPAEQFWQVLNQAGFGNPPGSGFPGETAGTLPHFQDWLPTRQTGLGFGYGLNTSLLVLSQAFTVFANDGLLQPLRFTAPGAEDIPPLPPVRVMSADIARRIRQMMEAVVTEGTGQAAQVPRYRVAGKTGTVHKAIRGGYAQDRYRALFIGIAPARKPRLLVAVVIDEPTVGGYYGGEVAAPVFAAVMQGALRLLNVAP